MDRHGKEASLLREVVVPAMVVVLVTEPAGQEQLPPGQPPLSIYVWANILHTPSNAAAAARVVVAGSGRPLAQAKHCNWVLQRQSLEQLKQQHGFDEVVLQDEITGALLEGLASNFYVER
eukprot:gene6244-6480_t